MTDGPAGGDFDADALTYEQLLDALEDLTEQMASGDVGIEEAAELYELAGHLHDAARDRLTQVQERIERLAPTDPPAPAGDETT